MEFSHYSTTGFGQHVKHALAQKVFASRYINRKSKCQFKEGSNVIQKHVHLHIFASGQLFPGPRKLIHQTLSCPHSFVKDLRNTIVTKSHYPVQGFQAKMDLNAAVFKRFHALMLGTGPTGISYWALTGHSMASSPAYAAMDNKPRCLSHQCCQGNLTLTPRTSKKLFSHRQRPTRRPSHGSGLAIIRKLLIVFSGPLASDNISLDFPTTSVSICLLWTKLSFVSICLPAQLMTSSFLRSRILPENTCMATFNI